MCEVIYDCFGDFEGFVLETCFEHRAFRSREKAIGKLAQRACRHRLLLSVLVERHGEHRIQRLIVRC